MVAAATAVDPVAPGAAGDPVVAVAGLQPVAPGAALDPVAPGLRANPVGAAASGDPLARRPAGDHVGVVAERRAHRQRRPLALAARKRPDVVGEPDGEEPLEAVGVPDLAALGVERGTRHRPVRGREAGCQSGPDRGVEVGDLARVLGVADVEHPQAREDHAAGDDPRVDPLRHVAVVARVALKRQLRPGVAGDLAEVLRLVHLEPQVRDHARPGLVADVDDPPGADLLQGPELIDLDHVGVVVDGHRDRVLRDAHRVPLKARDLAHLRVRAPGLDLGDVEDDQPGVDAGDIGAVAVVGDREPVRVIRPDPQRHRRREVRDVDRDERLRRRRRGVEGAPVGGHAALVAEDADRGRRLEHRVAAVGRDVVDVDQPRVERRVAEHRGEHAALLTHDQRLVRREHRRRDQLVGQHRIRRVRHVEHVDPGLDVDQARRRQQGGVVVRALAPGGVDVALDLEPADRPLRALLAVAADQLGVAGVALRRPAAGVVGNRDLTLEGRLRHRPGTALGGLGRRQRRLDRLLHRQRIDPLAGRVGMARCGRGRGQRGERQERDDARRAGPPTSPDAHRAIVPALRYAGAGSLRRRTVSRPGGRSGPPCGPCPRSRAPRAPDRGSSA